MGPRIQDQPHLLKNIIYIMRLFYLLTLLSALVLSQEAEPDSDPDEEKKEVIQGYLDLLKADRESKVTENCKDDCTYSNKFLSIFPMMSILNKKEGKQSGLTTVGFKNLYVFADHLAIFKG